MKRNVIIILCGASCTTLLVLLKIAFSFQAPLGEAIAKPHARPLTKTIDSIRPLAESRQGTKTDVHQQMVNSANEEQAMFSDLDAKFMEQLNMPYGFSVEPFRHELIWTSSGEASFKLANHNRTEITTIHSNFEQPPHLEVETSFGYTLFFYEGGLLKKKEIDHQLGTESDVVLLDLGGQKIHGMGFDETHGILYLGDQLGLPSRAILISDNNDEIIIKNITPF